MEEEKNIPSFLWVKHPPGSNDTVKLFLSRTDSQQWQLRKELELGESNEWLSFINKKSSCLMNFTSILGAIKYPPPTRTHTHTHTRAHLQQHPVLHGIHSLSTWKQCSQWSRAFAFTAEAEPTYQMATQNVFYCHWECVTENLDGFSCLSWLWHFPRTQSWES